MQFHEIYDTFFLIKIKNSSVSMTAWYPWHRRVTYDIAESDQVFVFQREWKNIAILELEKPSFEKLVNYCRHT